MTRFAALNGPAITRRAALAGAGALLLPAAVGASSSLRAERRFTILRAGSDIGRHAITLEKRDGAHHLAVDVDIVVRILGIAAYRYEMRNREVWRDGRLVSIDCNVNDDGTRKTVRATATPDGVEIDGSGFSGLAPAPVATTTYFTPDFLERPRWISTDNGEVYPMQVTRSGDERVETAAGPVDATRWRAVGGADFDATLFYDARGEWVSIAFDASGEPARYVADDVASSFAAVWAA
jgi:hypothetical protein